ncbi:MAG: DUF1385 domain-containing protein, partial [Clostridia bacterium]|nr:DUF1385 domain-containing protein [Clostridia bacterium]
GVMMRSPADERMSIAVRKEDGSIGIESSPATPLTRKNKFYALPIVRGVVNFVSMLVMGYQTLTTSARLYGLEEEEPSKFEKWLSEKLGKSTETIVMGTAMVLAVILAVGLFIMLPSFVSQLFKKIIENRVVVNLIEGLTRLVIFLLYMIAATSVPDVKRVFMYHGAEHKTIACFEAGEALTPENAKKHTRFHPRCGTSFLLIVMVISLLFFSVFGWDANYLTRVLSRLMLMPVVAGISYEVLKYLGKHDNALVRALRAPGIFLQRLTTKEPDEGMLEVAIAAFNACTYDKYKAEEPEKDDDKTETDTSESEA